MTSASTKRLRQLRETVAYHRQKYHTEDQPEISDEAYDALLHELHELEVAIEGITTTAHTVGDDVSLAFAKVEHRVRQWSFDNVFSYEELVDWELRLQRLLVEADRANESISYVVEHKIDGLKLIIEYESGVLVRCSTRGNGRVGEDVTHTARTITSLPDKLTAAVDLICVGEVWLGHADFIQLNNHQSATGGTIFANPRNAAAGSLRQLDPAVAASRNLSLTVYDIDYFDPLTTSIVSPASQWEELTLLTQLGLPTSQYAKRCPDLAAVQTAYDKLVPQRTSFPFAIDGMVIKVDRLDLQRLFGYTAKGPRFGIAYKLPAEQTTTIVEAITLQVGRTGVVTPVAELRPVVLAGSTISRATLHNEDFINQKDIRVGDTVIIQKAGDIIPEVVEVLTSLRPDKTRSFSFPRRVPGCGGDGSIKRIAGEAAYRCVSLDSDQLRRHRLYYLVSKQAFDIDGVGPRIIDQLLDAGLIKTAPDLFSLTASQIESLDGFKRKAADNVITAINQSRTIELYRLLIGLSIDGIGEETARLVADHYGRLNAIANASAEQIAMIHGIGDTVAAALVEWFTDQSNQAFLSRLTSHLTIINPELQHTGALSGKTLVLTGTLEALTRDEAKKQIRQAGGRVASSVSKKTDYVVAGTDPGSKVQKARELEVIILSESEFMSVLGA